MTRRMEQLQGVFVPLITPMFDDSTVDLEGVSSLAEHMLSSPSVNGLFSLGTTSEFMKLRYDERKAIVQTLAEIPNRRKPITVNVGGLPMTDMLELSEFACERGIDALTVVLPDSVDPDAESVFAYLEPIQEAKYPFLLYWTPAFSRHRSDMAVVEKLLEMPSFVGLKDSSQDMVVFTDLCTQYGQEISIFQGVEMLHLCSLAVGSAGVVGGGLNVYPRLLADISNAFAHGDLDKARATQQQVNRHWEQISAGGSFRSACKLYWKSQGFLQGAYTRMEKNLASESELEPAYAEFVTL